VAAILLVFGLHAPFASAEPENGWWWNPGESGRGFFVEIQGDFAFIGAYVYAANGRADWVISQGTMASPMSFNGRLLSFRNGQTLFGDYHAPGAPPDVGAIRVDFTDDRHAIVTWPGGTVPIERVTFDGREESLPIGTGWWWNEAEPGTGWSIELQGGTLFAVGFLYDADGNPVWYLSAGPMKSDTSYDGPLLQFANGQPIVGPYRAPGPPATVGRLTLDFTGPEEVDMTVSDDAAIHVAAIRTKRAASKQLTKTLKTKPKNEDVVLIPNRLIGSYTLHAEWEGASIVGPVSLFERDTLDITGTLDFSGMETQGDGYRYKVSLDSGNLVHKHDHGITGAGGCTGNSGQKVFFDFPPSEKLVINADLTYRARLSENINYAVTFLCPDIPPLPLVYSIAIDEMITGTVHYDKRGRVYLWGKRALTSSWSAGPAQGAYSYFRWQLAPFGL